MATVAELERLAALSGRLTPLTTMRQGALIRADDWNLLTGAVLELARLLLAEGGGGTVGEHEHVEAVDLGWLTPRLRALIEQGGLSDPVLNRRLITFERDGQKFKTQLDAFQSELAQLRVNVNEVKIGDIGRASDFTILRRKFEAQSDSREEVLDLRNTLGTIQTNINRALEIGDGLSAGGQLPNFAELFSRVADLEGLRSRLTNPDGTLLDAATLEIRLAGLQGNFVSQEQLDDALRNVRTRPPQDLLDQLRFDLQRFTDSRIATLRTEQIDEFDQRYARPEQLDQRLDTLATQLRTEQTSQVDGLRGEISQGFVSQDALQGQLDALTRDQLGIIDALVGRQLDGRLEKLQAALDDRYVTSAGLSRELGNFAPELQKQTIEAVRGDMRELVTLTFQEQGRDFFVSRDLFTEELRDVRRQIDALRRRGGLLSDDVLGQLSDRFVTLEALNTRLTAIENRPVTLPVDQLQSQIDAALSQALTSVESRLQTLAGLESRLTTTWNNQLSGLRQEIGSVAQQVVADQVQGLQNNLGTLRGQLQALDNRVATGLNLGPIRPILPGGTPAPAAESTPATADDFTTLEGVGTTFANRLQAAGIRTFAQLAATSDERLADLLATSVGQVKRRRLQAQAAAKRGAGGS